MTHQVQDEHNSTNHKWHKQGDTKLSTLFDKHLLMVTFENYSVQNKKILSA